MNGFFLWRYLLNQLSHKIDYWKATEKLYWIEGHMVYTNTLRKNLYIGQGTVCDIESLN